ATVGIWRFGLLSGIRQVTLDVVTVAEAPAGSPVARAVTVVGASSPDERRLHTSPAPELPGAAVPSQMGAGVARTRPGRSMNTTPAFSSELLPADYRAAPGGDIQISDTVVYANSTRYLRFDHPVDLGGTVTAVALPDGGVRVTNGTRLTLE